MGQAGGAESGGMIYLDYQATTPLAPEARAAMLPWLDRFGNPHAAHRLGREARAAVELARDQVAALLPVGGRLAFTGGATEALNWAIKGTRGDVVALAIEHAAVLDTLAAEQARGRKVTILPVGPDGLVDMAAARAAIRPGIGLVAAMQVNNEIGVFPAQEPFAELVRESGALYLCDAVQGFGRAAAAGEADLIAISAHKVHGPIGIGALWIRDGVVLDPLLHGGGQEAAGRSGTLSPMLCAGFGGAAQLLRERRMIDHEHVGRLGDRLRAALGPDWIVNGSIEHRYAGNLNVRHEGIDANRLISEVRDMAFSAGSACASGSGRSSHVLRAIGLSDAQARSSIRLGFGRYTTEAEIDEAAALINAAAARQLEWA
jgi:cysteine desulfurase